MCEPSPAKSNAGSGRGGEGTQSLGSCALILHSTVIFQKRRMVENCTCTEMPPHKVGDLVIIYIYISMCISICFLKVFLKKTMKATERRTNKDNV